MTHDRTPDGGTRERPPGYYDPTPLAASQVSDAASFMAAADLTGERYRGGSLDRCGCDGPHLATCPLREADHGA